jgi:threonine dehydrogenase-like Zn-dependent dehydrogenase
MCCRKGGKLSVPGVYGGRLDEIPIGALMNKGPSLKASQSSSTIGQAPRHAAAEGR